MSGNGKLPNISTFALKGLCECKQPEQCRWYTHEILVLPEARPERLQPFDFVVTNGRSAHLWSLADYIPDIERRDVDDTVRQEWTGNILRVVAESAWRGLEIRVPRDPILEKLPKEAKMRRQTRVWLKATWTGDTAWVVTYELQDPPSEFQSPNGLARQLGCDLVKNILVGMPPEVRVWIPEEEEQPVTFAGENTLAILMPFRRG